MSSVWQLQKQVKSYFKSFIDNCGRYYNPSSNLTIDEQLLNFRGNCRFWVYMKSKPARYGLKIFMMNDSSTWYMFNMYLYVGTSEKEKFQEKEWKQPAQTRRKKKGETTTHPPKKELVTSSYIKFLSRCIFGTNRAITVDNFFTSIDLFNERLGKKLMMLGAIRKNKSKIHFYFVKQWPPNSSLFAFDNNKVVVSYTPIPTLQKME